MAGARAPSDIVKTGSHRLPRVLAGECRLRYNLFGVESLDIDRGRVDWLDVPTDEYVQARTTDAEKVGLQ
jgi:hypothetical protein